MRIGGSFTTPATVDQLRQLFGSPSQLEQISVLSDIDQPSAGLLTMVFTPHLALGPVPLLTTVRTLVDSGHGVELAVVGRRGHHSVDVTLRIELSTDDRDASGLSGTALEWSADVVARGSVASVGQRVVRDLAFKAIDDLLMETAKVACALDARSGRP